MAFKPKTSVTAQEIPEDPHQLTANSFPKRAFGKKGDVLRSFQSDWLKKWPFLNYNESKYVVFCHTCMVAAKWKILSSGNLDPAFVSLACCTVYTRIYMLPFVFF